MGKKSNENLPGHVVCLVFPFLCCYSGCQHLSGSYLQMILATVLYCQVLHSLGTAFHPSPILPCREGWNVPRPTPNMSVSRYITLFKIAVVAFF